jgi:rare lipoprotein A
MPPGFLGEGLVSYYGPGLYGRKTASGERLVRGQLTAAHRALPFGSCVEVENMQNGLRVRVRVNDRGPFVAGRILDVSETAAKRLGAREGGVFRARLYKCPGDVAWR